MTDWLTWTVIGLSLAAAALAVVLMVRDEPAQDRTFAFLAVVEVVLLVQLVAGIVAVSQTERDVDGVLFVSYLVGLPLALPIGVFWSLAERSRSGTAVLLLAALTVAGLQLRLGNIWSAGG